MPSTALVIDDDYDVQHLSKLLLEQHGFAVETVGSLGELARKPALLEAELILLDLGLGKFTGLDILDYLHDLRLQTAVLLISASASQAVDHALEVGRQKGLNMLGFLPKARLLGGLADFLAPLAASAKAPWAAELEHAIESDELFLVYQPKKALKSGEITGVEALVRWQHPRCGLLFPDSFIPLAEKHDLMNALTWQMLELALIQQTRWRALGWDLNIAVNISAEFIRAKGVIKTFDALLKRHALPAPALTLELTESVGIECLGYASHVLEALRDRGCRLALDDFGTGYSSLVQLYRLPFGELKVDRRFVNSLESDEAACAIVLSVIDMGKRLGMDVVAEGIETAHQLERLTQAGCGLGQGYFISRPLTAAAFTHWFKTQRSSSNPHYPASTPSISSAS
ncbi:EAL domain-containing protein [Halomonas sp. HNIBRBA4712]|uniref:GGDEF/EAL domain-containing response regulator n=1 Tax=Halomonas sp. HNIBRBA4712 TaxID=3373087 RepID=UPI00374594A3